MRANEFIQHDRLDEGWADDARAKMQSGAQAAKAAASKAKAGASQVGGAVRQSAANLKQNTAPKLGGNIKQAAQTASALSKQGAEKIGQGYNAAAQGLDRIAQSSIGQKLGGLSQRLIGVGSTNAAGQQIWNKQFYSMVNNLIANSKNSAIPLNFGKAMVGYLAKQRIPVDPATQKNIITMGNQIQKNGFQRPEIVKLANTIWSIGSTAKSSQYGYQDKKMSDMTGKELQQALKGGPSAEQPAAPAAPAAAPTQTPAAPAASTAPVTPAAPAAAPTQTPAEPAVDPMADPQGRTEPTVAPVKQQSKVPVGTKFQTTTKSGKQVKAEKTDTGWKVGGVMVTDPKGVTDLETQATKTAAPKTGATRPATRPTLKPTQQAAPKGTQPVTRPARPKLKAPSALAKGTPGKPATAGKSRIR